MPILSGPGGAVSYDDYGTGPVVVLVHGSPATARAWQRVAERLSGQFRVVAPDLPGYGRTSAPPSERREASAYAAEVMESVIGEVGAPVVVAGHSYGGVVALRLALRGVVRPGALALFEPVAVPLLEAVGDRESFASARA